jgi:hypothetical protein
VKALRRISEVTARIQKARKECALCCIMLHCAATFELCCNATQRHERAAHHRSSFSPLAKFGASAALATSGHLPSVAK